MSSTLSTLRREHDVKTPGDPVIMSGMTQTFAHVVEARSHSVISGTTSNEQDAGTPGRSRPQRPARARS
jgi:hypothetical protein